MALDFQSIWCLEKDIVYDYDGYEEGEDNGDDYEYVEFKDEVEDNDEDYEYVEFEDEEVDKGDDFEYVNFEDEDEGNENEDYKLMDSVHEDEIFKDKNVEEDESKKRKPRTTWIYLQQIEVCPEIMKLIYDHDTKTMNKIMFKRYKNRIAKNHVDPVVGCVALIKGYHIGLKKIYAGNEYLTFWIYCKHKPCKRTFKATCSLNDASKGKFQLYHSDHEQVHTKYITRQIRQVDRTDTQECLTKVMPMEFRRQNIEDATEDLLEQKNLQDIKSDGVYYKIRHEALKLNDLHTNDVKDLEMMMEGEDRFIQKISKIPFSLNICSKLQCDVISKLANDFPEDERVGHLDATAGVVHHPYEFTEANLKQIYYYACVMNLKINSDLIGTLIPIFEFMTDCQEAVNLAEWIFAFKLYFRSKYPQIRTPFQRIVTDKSYALIHAVLEGFNDMSLNQYLRMSYDIASKKKSMENIAFRRLTKIHLCYTHASKVFSKNILKAFQLKKHTDDTKFLLKVLQFIAKCKEYEKIKRAFYYLATLFVKEFHGVEIETSYKMLNELINEQIEQIKEKDFCNNDIDVAQQEGEENDETKIEGLQFERTMYANSPFYHDFNNILEERCKTFHLPPSVRKGILKSKKEKNVFYNLDFVQTFTKNYLSIIPLWTGLLITDPKIIVYHNQHVESYFGISKTSFRRKPVLLGKLPTKCGRYIRENIKRTRRDIKGFKWDICKFRLATSYQPIRKNKKRKRNEEQSDSHPQIIINKKCKLNEEKSDYVSLAEAKEKWVKKRSRFSKKPVVKKVVKRMDVECDSYPCIDEASEYFQDNEEIKSKSYQPESISQNSINLTKTLPNGLIQDFRYYTHFKGFTYVVAVNNKKRLASEDFAYLSGSQWLSNTLIEYLLQVLLSRSKNIEGTCINSDVLFLKPSLEYKYKRFEKPYVLLPLHENNHFVLFILDIKNKIISYLDPRGEKQDDFERYIRNFKVFLPKYNSKFTSIGDVSEWRVKPYEHNIQHDVVNCGAFVVRFCQSFILKGEISYENFNPYLYRSYLKNIILETSNLDMQNICLVCGRTDHQTEEGVNWIKCSLCERWLHSLSCAEVDNKDYPDGVFYKCPLCTYMSEHITLDNLNSRKCENSIASKTVMTHFLGASNKIIYVQDQSWSYQQSSE